MRLRGMNEWELCILTLLEQHLTWDELLPTSRESRALCGVLVEEDGELHEFGLRVVRAWPRPLISQCFGANHSEELRASGLVITTEKSQRHSLFLPIFSLSYIKWLSWRIAHGTVSWYQVYQVSETSIVYCQVSLDAVESDACLCWFLIERKV